MSRVRNIQPVLDYLMMSRAKCSFALNDNYPVSVKVDTPEYNRAMAEMAVYNDITKKLLELPEEV